MGLTSQSPLLVLPLLRLPRRPPVPTNLLRLKTAPPTAMEDPLATAPAPPRRPHRERRHRRKASDAAAAALAAQAAASSYGDVFGGPPRFAPPPPAFAAAAGAGTTAPADYAEVFGGVAASCSIPYLDLPPAVACGDGDGGYGEIFGRFDFGDFAVPYEDMLPGAECLLEEIASPSGSSRYELALPPISGFRFFPLPVHCGTVASGSSCGP